MALIYEDTTATEERHVPHRPAPYFGAASSGPTYLYSEVDKENLPAHMLRAGCPSSQSAAATAKPPQVAAPTAARPPRRRLPIAELAAHVQKKSDRSVATVPLRTAAVSVAATSAKRSRLSRIR